MWDCQLNVESFVSSGDFTSYDQSRLNPVRGTMQIHQIVGIFLATTN
jgi:hypothetical protein